MFNKLEARVLSEYKRSRAAPSTICTLIKHYFSFIKHYTTPGKVKTNQLDLLKTRINKKNANHTFISYIYITCNHTYIFIYKVKKGIM